MRFKLTMDRNEQTAKFIQSNVEIFAWSHDDMLDIDPMVVVHCLNVNLG